MGVGWTQGCHKISIPAHHSYLVWEHCKDILVGKVQKKVKAHNNIAGIARVVPKYLPKLSAWIEGQAMGANHGGGVGNMSPKFGSYEEKRFKL